jgi:SAM-dependent methyltransferase
MIMGFAKDDVKFLLSGLKLGINTDSVLTLGRQSVMMGAGEVNKMLQSYGHSNIIPKDKVLLLADDIFEALGFKSYDSMDATDYESATIVHDLNMPVAASLQGRFDLVWDGGTLEHVFNFPTAMANALQMVKVGGHFVSVLPANNQCGHGFYQFSPELFFRIFSPENGYELIRIYMTGKGGPYHVADPVAVGGRVELLNSEGALLMMHARKTHEAKIFSTIPQQSDYVSLWDKKTEQEDGQIKKFLREVLSPAQVNTISRFLNVLRQQRTIYNWRRQSRLSNRNLYKPVTRWHEPSPGVNFNSNSQITDGSD